MSDEELRERERRVRASPTDEAALVALDVAQERAGVRRVRTDFIERFAALAHARMETLIDRVRAETRETVRAIMAWPRRVIPVEASLGPDYQEMLRANSAGYFFGQPLIDALARSGVPVERADIRNAIAEMIRGIERIVRALQSGDDEMVAERIGETAARVLRFALIDGRDPSRPEAFAGARTFLRGQLGETRMLVLVGDLREPETDGPGPRFLQLALRGPASDPSHPTFTASLRAMLPSRIGLRATQALADEIRLRVPPGSRLEMLTIGESGGGYGAIVAFSRDGGRGTLELTTPGFFGSTDGLRSRLYCSGEHLGTGAPDCPRERHHHHDGRGDCLGPVGGIDMRPRRVASVPRPMPDQLEGIELDPSAPFRRATRSPAQEHRESDERHRDLRP